MSKRLPRLNEQLKRELTDLIRREVRDPRVGLVTITGVETAADLGSAKVYVRSGEGPAAMDETLQGLQAAAPFLRSKLGRILHVRKVPELRFRPDRSFEQAQRIEELLADVLPGEAESGEDASEGGERGEHDVREEAADAGGDD